MRRLRKLGCNIALDDFGTGLSSLAYLRTLPIGMLKIDGSFVRDVLKDPRAESMVQAIAQLARAMSLTTVAEYVETDEIRTRITALGVDYGQGFAIGRPDAAGRRARRAAAVRWPRRLRAASGPHERGAAARRSGAALIGGFRAVEAAAACTIDHHVEPRPPDSCHCCLA